MARAQHRWIVDALRAGQVEEVLNPESANSGRRGRPEAGGRGKLAVELLGSRRQDDKLILRLRVVCGGNIASRAQVGVNWKIDSSSGVLQTG